MKWLHTLAFAVGLTVAMSGTLSAQMLSVGARGGVDFAQLGGDAGDGSTRTAFTGGVFVDFNLGGLFSLSPEVMYAQKGTDFDDLGFDSTLELDYIEFAVPINLIPIPLAGSILPHLFASPTVALEVNCELSASGVSGSVACDAPELDPAAQIATKSIDFGLLFGGGVSFPVGPGSLSLDVRYNLGLNDINDNELLTGSIKNRNLQVLGGFAFNII